MKIIDRVKKVFGLTSTQTNYLVGGPSLNLGSLYYHAILQLLRDVNTETATPTDPRALLPVYRAIVHSLPFMRKALEVHGFMMGQLELTSEDEGLKRVLEDFQNNFCMYPEIQSDFVDKITLGEFITQAIVDGLEDGTGFFLLRGAADDEPVDGAVAFNSANFRLNLLFNKYQLEYTDPAFGGTYYVDGSNPMFHRIRPLTSSRHEWGLSIAYGSEFIVEQLLRLIVTRTATHARLSNPPTITTIMADTEDMTNASLRKEFTNFVDKLKEKWESGMSHQLRRGQPFDIITPMPGATKLETHVFGEGVTPMAEFTDEAKFFALNAAQICRVPTVFLGFNSEGGDGFGSDKYRLELDMTQQFTDRFRRKGEALARKAAKAHLMTTDSTNARWLDLVDVEWSEPTLEDMKTRAEIAKTEAEAELLRIQVFDQLARIMAGGTAEGIQFTEPQTEYADRINRPEWVG